MRTFLPLFILALAVSPFVAAHAQSDVILGEWLNEEKDGKVTIYKQDEKYYGKISWLEESTNDDGGPRTDENNPDPKLQSAKLQGLVILKNFSFDGEEWKGGKIYDPKNGKTYSCYMRLNGPQLKIRGFVMGMRALGRTTYWTRP